MIDPASKSVPHLDNILHTFHGDILSSGLANKKQLFEDYYQTMFKNGMITEEEFESKNVRLDSNSQGNNVI